LRESLNRYVAAAHRKLRHYHRDLNAPFKDTAPQGGQLDPQSPISKPPRLVPGRLDLPAELFGRTDRLRQTAGSHFSS